MAKAINWPEAYRHFWLTEADPATTYCALRLGDLYFTNQYWVPAEVVDLRAGHKRIRKATVTQAVEQYPLEALPALVLASLPLGLGQSLATVQAFLIETYQQPVTPQTLVTVVYYHCHPVDLDEVEAP
jgi:hypothetical protein